MRSDCDWACLCFVKTGPSVSLTGYAYGPCPVLKHINSALSALQHPCVCTQTHKHISQRRLHRAASFWLGAAVSSWQLANGLTFASDNPGPEPGCLFFCLSSPPLWFPLFLTLCHPSLLSLFSHLTQVLVAHPSSSRVSCSVMSSSSSAHLDELASLQVSSSLSQHGWVAEGREHGGLC